LAYLLRGLFYTGKPVMTTKDDGRTPHICACFQCREHPQGDVAQQHTALNQFLALPTK
jgi:hypothetical protein